MVIGHDIHLSDGQYLEILRQIVKRVNEPDFKPSGYDSDFPGCHETGTNCSMCCDDFATKDNVLFPDEFPNRKNFKYRQDHQCCPFDMDTSQQWPSGCFYRCYIFMVIDHDIALIKQLAQQCLDIKEEQICQK